MKRTSKEGRITVLKFYSYLLAMLFSKFLHQWFKVNTKRQIPFPLNIVDLEFSQLDLL